MTVTTAPADEACLSLVDRINEGTGTYALNLLATYERVAVDRAEEVSGLRVDVLHESEQDLNETLDVEQRTSHEISVYIREKLPDLQPETLAARALVVRQIFQRVNQFNSSDQRVKVWDCNRDKRMDPDKNLLRKLRMFVARIVLRVEVEPSYP